MAVSSRRPSGLVFIDGKEVADTLQCAHCGSHWEKRPGSGKIRGFCMNCMGAVCGAKCQECTPWQKKMELYEQGKSDKVM